MPLNPGNDTVTFDGKAYTGTPNQYGVNAIVHTVNNQGGCAMQPISGSDKINDTTYSEATWKCISPATPITQAIQAEDTLQFLGVTYRILFVKPYRDNWSRLDHITFMCKEENG